MLPMVFNNLSQDQKTYIILFLTHVVVSLYVLIYVFGTDILCWIRNYSQDKSQANQKQSSEIRTINNVTEIHLTEQSSDSENVQLDDSYALILVDNIRVMIRQAANEQVARNIIHQVLSEELPKYFHNDKIIDLNNIFSGILIESKGNEPDDGGGNEEKNSLLQEDVIGYCKGPEKDQEYMCAITDNELISMISDILLSSKADYGGTPSSPFEVDQAPKSPAVRRPVFLMDQEEENQEFEQRAKESKMGYSNEDDSVEMSSLPDQMHFLPGNVEDSYFESADHESGLVYPLCKEDLDGSLSWPSLSGESRVPLENDHDTNAYFTAQTPQYAFRKPSCVITTSSCRSCNNAEVNVQNNELTPTHVLPTAAHLSLSGSIQGSFSEVLSKLTRIKRTDHKRKTGTARELWSSNSQEEDTSIFNASFSLSSLEDMLSAPESIPPTPSSPVFGSPEKSPHVLGIRLHKPAGFKDIFLSVVDHDYKTGLLRNISDTWTLGTREEMELILHVDTDPHLRATKTYSGRYCLAFYDKSDLDEYLSNQESQEDFGFSMLCSHDNSKEEQEVEIPSEEEYFDLSFFSHAEVYGREEDQEIVRELLQTNDLEEEVEEEEEEEEKEEEEDLFNHVESSLNNYSNEKENQLQKEEELPQDEKSDQDHKPASAEQLYKTPRKWGRKSHRILAFACLALTSYLAHRFLK